MLFVIIVKNTIWIYKNGRIMRVLKKPNSILLSSKSEILFEGKKNNFLPNSKYLTPHSHLFYTRNFNSFKRISNFTNDV